MMFDNLFKNISATIQLSGEDKNYLTTVFKPKTYSKKEFVLRAGEFCGLATFVNSGCLKVFYEDAGGREHVAKFAIENWWAFDLESFTTQVPAFYSIQAIEHTQVLQIGKNNYEELFHVIPQFERFFRLMFQNSYIQLQHRVTQNLYADAEERFLHFEKKYPGLEQRVSQREIASYLGITPEFLSMLRKRRRVPYIS